MTEKELMAAITRMAKQLGFMVYHAAYSIGSERGFPDLTITGYGCLWFIECKGPKPKVYPEQEAWIAALTSAGVSARIIYPDDLDDVLNDLMTAYQEANAA